MKKTIYFYRTVQWGVEREYVAEASEPDGAIIRRLTCQRTINGVVRELIRDLTGGSIEFVEVLAPAGRKAGCR